MKLGLVFTRNISLATWDRVGNLVREVRPYIELSREIEEIYFFTYGVKEERYGFLFPKNIRIISKPKFIPGALYMFLMPIIRAKHFRKLDIIKTNQMDGSWAGVIGKKIFKKKLMVRSGYEWLNYLKTTRASWWKKNIARVVENWSYKNADRIIITSNEDQDFIVREFNIPKNRIEVVRNYIDTDHFVPNLSLQIENRIIFVGRLEEDKNLPLLVDSLKGLPCELFLIGSGSQKEKIQNLAKEKGVRVNFLGQVAQEKLPIELSKSAIFILPSKSEGNPKALLEAMSCGLACVGTNVKGIREVIAEGETGLLADLSAESLHEKIKTLLENKELRDRLGANAREMIVRDYSLETIINKEKLIYESFV